jgi:hypothetical protein
VTCYFLYTYRVTLDARAELEEAAESALDALLDHRLELMIKPHSKHSKRDCGGGGRPQQHPDSFCRYRTSPPSCPAPSPPLPMSRSAKVVVKEGCTL